MAGIDPGLDGAIVLLTPDRRVACCWDAPTSPQTPGSKRVHLEGSMRGHLASCGFLARSAGTTVLIAIERINAMPPTAERKMGAASAFNMGLGWGLWRGICVGLELPYQLVTPQAWKGRYAVAGKQAGGDSRVTAQRLLPGMVEYTQRKKDHGRADAALIALYALETGGHDG